MKWSDYWVRSWCFWYFCKFAHRNYNSTNLLIKITEKRIKKVSKQKWKEEIFNFRFLNCSLLTLIVRLFSMEISRKFFLMIVFFFCWIFFGWKISETLKRKENYLRKLELSDAAEMESWSGISRSFEGSLALGQMLDDLSFCGWWLEIIEIYLHESKFHAVSSVIDLNKRTYRGFTISEIIKHCSTKSKLDEFYSYAI